MRIAITGGTGFVGRHLAARLARRRARRGHRCRVGPVTASMAMRTRARRGLRGLRRRRPLRRHQPRDRRPDLRASPRRGDDRSISSGPRRRRRSPRHAQLPAGPPGRTDDLSPLEVGRRGARPRSGLTYTILKAGVIHGRGDHMLDHLSHAFHTFPLFGLVGLRERPVRPVAVDDVARILEAAALGDPRLADRTIAVLGPEEMPLGTAVRRVAVATGRRPWFVRLPIAAHLVIARIAEWTMRVPLISTAQVHILAEGIVETATVRRCAAGRPRPRRRRSPTTSSDADSRHRRGSGAPTFAGARDDQDPAGDAHRRADRARLRPRSRHRPPCAIDGGTGRAGRRRTHQRAASSWARRSPGAPATSGSGGR